MAKLKWKIWSLDFVPSFYRYQRKPFTFLNWSSRSCCIGHDFTLSYPYDSPTIWYFKPWKMIYTKQLTFFFKQRWRHNMFHPRQMGSTLATCFRQTSSSCRFVFFSFFCLPAKKLHIFTKKKMNVGHWYMSFKTNKVITLTLLWT